MKESDRLVLLQLRTVTYNVEGFSIWFEDSQEEDERRKRNKSDKRHAMRGWIRGGG